jgi:hypothetical protein
VNEEPKSFCRGDSVYYPVWIEHDGTEWASQPVWEECEHGSDPSKWSEELQNAPSGKSAPTP